MRAAMATSWCAEPTDLNNVIRFSSHRAGARPVPPLARFDVDTMGLGHLAFGLLPEGLFHRIDGIFHADAGANIFVVQ